MRWLGVFQTRAAFAALAFAVLATAILTRPPKSLTDFDQSFYITIAYDIEHHGVFSNGIFDDVNSVVAVPPPGMFFGPLYPGLIVAAMKFDPRFARAVDCSVEANHKARDGAECESYVRPMLILHALFLTAGVLAIAISAEVLLASRIAFWLAGGIALAALLPFAELFSYVMTESVTFGLYGADAAVMLAGLATSRRRYFALGGVLLGTLCLARFAFMALIVVFVGLIVLNGRLFKRSAPLIWSHIAAFGLSALILIVPWAVRNYISVGRFALTEEYGSVTLVERFAYDQMTVREFFLAFPYCVPTVGPAVVGSLAGSDAMARLEWEGPGTFFAIGRADREALVAVHKRLDPIIADLFRAEMQQNGWQYLAVNVPLAWCGLWVGGLLALFLVPSFAWACIKALRQSRPLFLLYATPPVAMLGLHVVLANHDLRYNLNLIGPYAVGAAWIVADRTLALGARGRAQQKTSGS